MKNSTKSKPIELINLRTKETWICENIYNKRIVDGVDFVEVHKPGDARLMWINLTNLAKKQVGAVK